VDPVADSYPSYSVQRSNACGTASAPVGRAAPHDRSCAPRPLITPANPIFGGFAASSTNSSGFTQRSTGGGGVSDAILSDRDQLTAASCRSRSAVEISERSSPMPNRLRSRRDAGHGGRSCCFITQTFYPTPRTATLVAAPPRYASAFNRLPFQLHDTALGEESSRRSRIAASGFRKNLRKAERAQSLFPLQRRG